MGDLKQKTEAHQASERDDRKNGNAKKWQRSGRMIVKNHFKKWGYLMDLNFAQFFALFSTEPIQRHPSQSRPKRFSLHIG